MLGFVDAYVRQRWREGQRWGAERKIWAPKLLDAACDGEARGGIPYNAKEGAISDR